MSDLKFASNLFLEVAELNRLKQALRDTGFAADFKNETEVLGIVRNQYFDPNFNYFQAINTNVANSLFVSPGFAYDSNRNVLTSTGATLAIPQPNTYYWVKISYASNNTEQGTVSIGGSNGGLLSGLGTAFTKVLRGQPNFPSKIVFLNSVNYQQQYEILEVDSDNVAYLQGSFPIAEANLQYAIVGTFTPGTYPPTTDQFPFLYDSFTYSLVPETGNNVMPNYQQGLEFFIARVISTTQGVQIQDVRQSFICQSRAERLFSELPNVAKPNPLIGIEQITKTAILNKILYTVNINWGFRVTTESRNYNTNLTTITTGSGGIYATANAFNTGDFDGWRYYYQDGSYSRIISSVKNGSGIDLQLDTLKNSSAGAMVCPNAEEIEIALTYYIATPTGSGQVYNVDLKKFYIFTQNPTLLIDQTNLDPNFMEVDVQYRYKTVLMTTAGAPFNASAYTVPDLSAVVSRNILLTVNNVNPPATTAWEGIDPFCVVDSLATPIYYKIVTQNTTVIPTVYYPNSSFPVTSIDETTVQLVAQFYSDSALTTPVNVTHPNLRILVLETDTVTQTQYSGSGSTSNNFVNQKVLVYFVSPAAVNSIVLGTVDSSNKSYIHPTNQVGTREITNDTESVYGVWPTNNQNAIVVGNTGDQGFNTLQEYYTATNQPTGNTTPNIPSDPNYIAPAPNPVDCTTYPPNVLKVQYGFNLDVTAVTLVGTSSGTQNAPAIANTQAGGYNYIMNPYLQNENVLVTVNANTIAGSGNQTGFVWVRVTWQAPGSSSVTYTNQQIPVGVATQLNTAFTNIQLISVSNY